jgi:hypothetical protein
VRQRIEDEAALVARSYPALKLALDTKTEAAALQGSIVHREELSGVPTSIGLRFVLRDGYPRTEPLVYETSRVFDRTTLDGHVLSNGRLCLWLPPRSQWQGRDPDHPWSWRDPDALLRLVDQTVLFAERHLIWQVTGKWPGRESAHGDQGYVEYIHEVLGCDIERLGLFASAFGERDAVDPYASCPCGSGSKYRFCHLERVRELRRECGTIDPAAFSAVARRDGR